MKRILMIILVGLLMFSMVSAFEFDNVKNYNIELKEVTIENALGLGNDVAKIKLTSPLNIIVPRGYQKVAEFDLTYYMDDNGGLDIIEFFNVKDSMNEIDRQFDFKIKQIEEVLVNDYETVCNNIKSLNGTYVKECTQNIIGTHTEERIVWNNFDEKDLLKSKQVTIGIFTNVQGGDIVEWVPTFYGVEISEWAIWTESLSVDLMQYYAFEQLSGVVVDEQENYSGTNNGADRGATGKVNNAFEYVYANTDYINASASLSDEDWSFSIWVKTDLLNDPAAHSFKLYNTADADTSLVFFVNNASDIWDWRMTGDGATLKSLTIGNSETDQGSWQHFVGTYTQADANMTLYKNGIQVDSDTYGGGTFTIDRLYIGGSAPTSNNWDGFIDEFGLWGRVLSQSEVTQLYNGGSGIEYDSSGISVTTNAPIDNYNSSIQLITFNCTVITRTLDIINVSLYINGTINETNSSGINNTNYIFTETLGDGSWNWTCESTNNNSQTETATYKDFLIDSTYPTLNITYPDGEISYKKLSINETLNWTVSDNNLDDCWYGYGGVNTTVTCIDNTTGFVLISGSNDITFYVNDSTGNLNSTTKSWVYKILENNRTHNTTTYETDYQTYSINVTANSSLTAIDLLFNGTSYAMVNGGSGIWSYSRDLPENTVGNNSINFSFTYGAETIYPDTLTYQYVNDTIFTLCNSSYTNDFLNISFKDESNSSAINATIPTSTFEYYLGTGTVTKTYQLINNTGNTNYSFCATPNVTFHVDPYVQYANTGYPQRIWNPDLTDYTSTVTNQVLYLLDSVDGIYVTIQVINSGDQVISGVSINVTREISGEDVEVGQGTTGDDGTVTFWLNPDFSHTFELTKTGFTDYTTTFTPTQSSYTITMAGGGTTVSSDYTRGILLYTYPTQNELFNGTSYDFEFNVTSSYWDLDSFGFNLRLANGTIVGSDSSTVGGTAASSTYNVNNRTIIYMDYYWIIEGNTTSSNRYWIITNTEYEGWSIKTFFTDLTLYLDSGLFGIDDFGRILIVFLILFTSVGIMSYKFGLISPMAVTSMIFAIIFFFDVVVGLIPQIRGIDYVLTYLAGLMLILSIFNEVSR